MDWKDFFRGKRITVMGLGLLGRGLGDTLFLAECGAELIVTDRKGRSELAPSLDKLKSYPDIKFVLGEHRLEDFRDRDFILKAAGIPLDSPYITEARKHAIPIEMDASLFAKLAPRGVTIVGITGTRGKTTTTVLLFEILKAAGRRVFLGGNIKDTATLPLLKVVKAGDYVVLELDSWQLQGFGESKISPHVAVFTTFMPDHMNYYAGDMEKYFDDKENIFRFQKPEDGLIVGEQAAERIGAAKPPIPPTVARVADVPSDWKIQLLGEHNHANIACAVAAARALGVKDVTIRASVESFGGVEGRLQFLRELNGVKIYNDNNATTPDATVAALRALGGAASESSKRIILIMGGTDKGLDMSALVEVIPKYCKGLVLLKESGAEKFLASSLELPFSELNDSKKLQASSYPRSSAVADSGLGKLKASLALADTLGEAVRLAFALAERGDTVLFSPAFASFGRHFKNEYDRGEQFVSALYSLKF